MFPPGPRFGVPIVNNDQFTQALDNVTGTMVGLVWSVPLFLLLLGCGCVLVRRWLRVITGH